MEPNPYGEVPCAAFVGDGELGSASTECLTPHVWPYTFRGIDGCGGRKLGGGG